ncbi:MAG TPA: hypothetical protein VGF16_09335 [Bryobacteraceae bacterium]
MRPFLFLFLAAPLCAAPLAVVRPVISDSDGGAVLPPTFEHIPGDTLFFFCRVGGFQKTAEEKIHLAYTVDAVDAKGVPIAEPFHQDIMDEVTPEDKDWMPKIQTEIMVPPLAGSGTYKILIKVEDLVAKTTAESSLPFQVKGRDVAPSDTLIVRNFQFFGSEEDTHPLEKAAYRPGEGVWARFDITGFKYGPKNKVDVSYVTSVIAESGKVLWTQPEPAVEQSESFYPKRFVPASMGITLQNNIRPGAYTITVQAKDAVGDQTYETKQTFTVE